MRAAERRRPAAVRVPLLNIRGALAAIAATTLAMATAAQAQAIPAPASCTRPVYLTLDTGHMEIAPFVAEVLQRQQVRVTFFAANEPTKAGDGSLGEHWAPWWKARAAEGHEFASHTYDHAYWRGDVKETSGAGQRFRIRPSAGPNTGKEEVLDVAGYCAEIRKSADRLQQITGKKPLPLFRAPGGKTSPALLAAARSCGYAHASWAPAGFLGDELPSEAYPNAVLLQKALRDIRAGDILLAHLGIWSRKDPWALADLEPLIVGLKQKGYCFETLREHPDFRAWIAQHP